MGCHYSRSCSLNRPAALILPAAVQRARPNPSTLSPIGGGLEAALPTTSVWSYVDGQWRIHDLPFGRAHLPSSSSTPPLLPPSFLSPSSPSFLPLLSMEFGGGGLSPPAPTLDPPLLMEILCFRIATAEGASATVDNLIVVKLYI